MIDIKSIKRFPLYVDSLDGRIFSKIDKNGIATTSVKDFRYDKLNLQIEYHYTCENNTWNEATAKKITRKEFIEKIEQLQKELKVKFTIK